MKDDLLIDSYPNLQSIVVKKNSLKNLNSLKICNCENLESIEIEEGVLDIYWSNNTFNNVKSVLFESTNFFIQ